MSETADQMELSEAAIRAQYPVAEAKLTELTHRARIAEAAPRAEASAGLGTRRRFRSTTPGLAARHVGGAETVRLLERIAAADDGDVLTSPVQAQVAHALRRALAIALALGQELGEATGLAALQRANREGRLDPARAPEFAEQLEAEALVVLYVFANALGHALAPHRGEVALELPDAEEVLTENAPLALDGALWELDRRLAEHGRDDAHLLAVMLAQADAVMAAVESRAAHAAGLAAFEARSWRVEADDLTVQGFTPASARRSNTLTMSFKKPHEVVGNHIAKYQALRLSKMLMAYDFERRLNPFAELGGFIFTFMGDGAPGTGKTTLIQMMAGLISGYCEGAGYPFRYANLSTESIDSYQGKSAQNAKSFIREILDPAVIGFGTIDDIDQLAGKRGDRQASAGQLEITAVLMESFAGANTVVRGNCTFGMFSNYPEQVDDALRQRAGARFLVDGPQTREDYIDILTLLMGKHHDIPLGAHDLYAAQAIEKAVARSYESHGVPHEAGLRAVFDAVQERIGPLDTLARLGTYLKAIQEADPRFTGRAIKNITDAVKVRAMDFELPDEWMEEPELFLRKDYATKTAMIADLRRPITVEMVVQEINRYADSEFRYADKSDAVAIDEMVRHMERSEEAKRRYLEGKG